MKVKVIKTEKAYIQALKRLKIIFDAAADSADQMERSKDTNLNRVKSF